MTDSWTYAGGSILNAPEWLRHRLEFIEGVLILDRDSGKQEVRKGECIHSIDGEIVHDVPGAAS